MNRLATATSSAKDEVQTILFRKKDWTFHDAVDWLRAKGYKGLDPDVKPATYRFRQKDPKPDADFRSVALPDGVVIVYQHAGAAASSQAPVR
jgi:hypothetical protein